MHVSATKRRQWVVSVSKTAENTFNPIRNVVDTMKIEPNPNMEVIKLTVGTCTVLCVQWRTGWFVSLFVGWLAGWLDGWLGCWLQVGLLVS